MKIKILSLLLFGAMLLSLLSCGGEMPTHESVSPTVPTQSPNEEIVQEERTALPYESVCFLSERLMLSDGDGGITVIRSAEELAPYNAVLTENYDALLDTLKSDSQTEDFIKNLDALTDFDNLHRIFSLCARNQSLQKDKYLLLMVPVAAGKLQDFAVTDVSLVENGNDKRLVIDTVAVQIERESDVWEYTLLLVLPGELDVDFETQIMLNKETLYDLPNDGAHSLIQYHVNRWGWTYEENQTPYTSPQAELIPFESLYGYVTAELADFYPRDEEIITVCRSQQDLASLLADAQSGFEWYCGYVLSHSDRDRTKTFMDNLIRVYRNWQAISAYDSEEYFADHVFLIINTTGTGVEQIVTTDVTLTEENGKRKLQVGSTCIHTTGNHAMAEYVCGFTLSLPNDLDIDYENDVIVKWDGVLGSYLDRGVGVLQQYRSHYWAWK